MFNGQAGPGVVEVSLEKLRPGMKPETAGEVAWEIVAGFDSVTLTPSQDKIDKLGNTTWAGDVTLPNSTDTFRMIIKEFEVYSEGELAPFVRRRMVYADAIEM